MRAAHKRKQLVRLEQDGYKCLLCEERREQIDMRYDPLEIPRHLEKSHDIYSLQFGELRQKLIADWNPSFEKQYRDNLYNEIKFLLYPNPPIIRKQCPKCKGTGKFRKKTCDKCLGSGHING